MAGTARHGRHDDDPGFDRLDADDLAERASIDAERLARLVDAGLVGADPDGRFDAGDVHRVRLIEGFLAAGIPLEVLADAARKGEITFGYYDQLHPPVGPSSDRTWGELLADLGPHAGLLRRWITAVGVAEPASDSRLPVDVEALLVEVADTLDDLGHPDLGLRIARVQGDAAHRVALASLSAYGEAIGRMGAEEGDAASINERFEHWLGPWARLARLAPDVTSWIQAQHLSASIDAFSVERTERYFETRDYLSPRPPVPVVIAFVDLAGFTALAERMGDAEAARVASAFADLADETARAGGGRVVKLLGDGALLRFDDPADAVAATLRLLELMPGADLPEGHAGLAAGPVVERDGDVFGRTVNLAARISDVAAPTELLVPATVVALLPEGRFLTEGRGRAELAGVAGSVELVRVLGSPDGGVHRPSR